MSFRANAFATLAAVGLLVLAAALLAGAILGSQQILLGRDKAERIDRGRSAAWKAVGELLTTMQESWNADKQSVDAWWIQHSPSFPGIGEFVSLSARINLNSMSPFLLRDSELIGTLRGRTVEDFITYRLNKGPFYSVEDCKDYFQPAALNSMYCVHSLLNVNTADEIMLEKVLAARTGSQAFASTIRARLRQYRTNREVLTEANWAMLAGAQKDTIGDLVTTDPEIDVNTAPVEILQALMRDPDLKLTQPDAKLQTIVAGRATKPWNSDTLRQALGVDKSSLLLQYLGTRSRFLRGRILVGSSTMTFVVHIGYSDNSPPKIVMRVIDSHWDKS